MRSGSHPAPPGRPPIAMSPAGSDPGSPPILSATVDIAPGTAHTVAGLGYFADLGLEVLDDDLTLPSTGQSRVRVINAAADAQQLDVILADGTPVTTDLAFATATNYVDVSGGPTTLNATPAGGEPMQLPVDLAAGSVYTILVLDDENGGMTVQTAPDAASPGGVSVGGGETGGGGAADGGGGTTAGAGGPRVAARGA